MFVYSNPCILFTFRDQKHINQRRSKKKETPQVEDCCLYESKRAGDFKIFPKIIKKQIKEGEGYDKPNDFAKVTLKVFALACRCKAGTPCLPRMSTNPPILVTPA